MEINTINLYLLIDIYEVNMTMEYPKEIIQIQKMVKHMTIRQQKLYNLPQTTPLNESIDYFHKEEI